MSLYLLFDADMTLYDFNSTEQLALSRTFQYLGLKGDREDEELYQTINRALWSELENGAISLKALRERRFSELIKKRGIANRDGIETERVYEELLSSNGLLLNGAASFLDSIKNRRMSLITNGIAHIQRGRIRGTNTASYFEHLFISEEIGFSKPDSRFFDYVLSRLSLSKEDCLVIGDSETSDIEGARRSGIKSVFLNFQGKVSDKATYSVASYEELKKLISSL